MILRSRERLSPSLLQQRRVNALEPQFRLSSNHYNEISNRCDEIIGILSKFDRSDAGDTNQLVDSAKALYDVFLTAEQRTSPSQSPVPTKSSENQKNEPRVTRLNSTVILATARTHGVEKRPIRTEDTLQCMWTYLGQVIKEKSERGTNDRQKWKSENDTSDSRSNSGREAR
ncbi:hypothetical protein K493DRAFT_411791 [Basidiobolus meristosporus CBS 931.73]|uniref:Uncharacterized protein n=1 Tax=Basidiobolus meristosporus CBS 931.73 TaxID=1314790 RepID=A0A1Y1XA89_9FUNG|nr:hypothetical protein K493DRAFT_411791 [Basidiobolus meristosporus CBS 931.73]|eukprot:ORX82663.1 hypothetical protein K493DRAFT_411791 [Basidiobolus meristosporus CBS 931.73]